MEYSLHHLVMVWEDAFLKALDFFERNNKVILDDPAPIKPKSVVVWRWRLGDRTVGRRGVIRAAFAFSCA